MNCGEELLKSSAGKSKNRFAAVNPSKAFCLKLSGGIA